MIESIEQVRSAEVPAALPERLGNWGTVLFASDAIMGILCIAVLAGIGVAASAFLAMASASILALAMGRYRESYAMRPRDEWYQTAAIATTAAPVGMILSLAFGLAWWGALAAALLWLGAAGMSSAALQRMRRGDRSFDPALGTLHHPRHGSRTSFELGVIRCFDAILAIVGLVVTAPLMAYIALRIRREDGDPVLFKQLRVGTDDTDFTLAKFRTMRQDAGSAWARPGDSRITPFGAFLRRSSLDELPQLVNVALGQMSLVGPRPEMREYANRFLKEVPLYSIRHVVRPGMTGWAQLYLPRNLEPGDAPRVVAYDLFYVEHVCVYLYLFCLTKTVCELRSHGAV
ncbi:MAG TPA: sugar transferase [Candidatus Acidoferrum sp.]|nr:sugar transferase [Candidatus Acidoferrum sp.]